VPAETFEREVRDTTHMPSTNGIIRAAAEPKVMPARNAGSPTNTPRRYGARLPSLAVIKSINILDRNNDPTIADLGLTSKEVHEARLIRDADAPAATAGRARFVMI
jgi:hypothetical protein